jgi:hypothetical protein
MIKPNDSGNITIPGTASLRAWLSGMAMQGFLCQQSDCKARDAVVKLAQRFNLTEVQIIAGCSVEQADAA